MNDFFEDMYFKYDDDDDAAPAGRSGKGFFASLLELLGIGEDDSEDDEYDVDDEPQIVEIDE